MGEYLSPWLYLRERSASAGAVAAVSTSTYATCAWLPKGPVNQPQLVTSFAKFKEIFGGYWRNSYVPFSMAAFFSNEGARAYISRVVPEDASKASKTDGLGAVAAKAVFYSRVLTDPVITLDASHYNIKVNVGPAGTPAEIDVTGDLGVGGSYTLTALASTINTALAALSPAGACEVEGVVGGGNRLKFSTADAGLTSTFEFSEPTANDCSQELLGLDVSTTPLTVAGAEANEWTQEAAWPGSHYNQVRMCVTGNPDYLDGSGGYTAYDVEIQEESSLGAGDWETVETYEAVVFDDDTSDQFAPTVINEDTEYQKLTEGTTYTTPASLKAVARSRECCGSGDAAQTTFSGTLLYPSVYEDSLSIVAGGVTAQDQGDGTLAGTGISAGTINYATGAWSLTFTAAPAAGELLIAEYTTEPVSEDCSQLEGGTDGTGPITRGLVSDPILEADKAGIYSFNEVDEILNMSLPDFPGIVSVANDLFAYAEGRKDRFIITTTAMGVTPTDAVKWVRNTAQYNTSYGALYYPWVKIEDPIANDGRGMLIPPDGFVAGVFARTDVNRNVGKAPAGINEGKLIGAIGLERNLDKGERDVVYPARINPLVSTPQTGRAVWGARTLSYDPEWKYTQVRRLFIFCEKSIYNSSFWACFENNGPGLWGKMKAQGDGFFLNIFNDGYLAGNSPSEAWFIKADGDNNPQEAIDAGLLTVDYFIAPNKPAEFIRLRFQQRVKSAA